MMDYQKVKYVISGLFRRGRQKRICPSCGSAAFHNVDRKGFHVLLQCNKCGLLYRWPYETQEEMARFYQRSYRQAGLTTDLPDQATLGELLANGFKGSEKDFSHVVELLRVLAVQVGARILDFGANWGYGVWQLRNAGFDAVGYELSKPRAEFSKKLGVDVITEWAEIRNGAPYDVVFSSHVLEHTPDPAEALRRKLEVVSPGGLLIALFPNGSEMFQKADPAAFHKLWGRVHAVMLNETFIRKVLLESSIAIGSRCPEDIKGLELWDRATPWIGTLNTGEMLVVAVTPVYSALRQADT